MALRAGIAGTGFIGKVHARSLRLAGAELACGSSRSGQWVDVEAAREPQAVAS